MPRREKSSPNALSCKDLRGIAVSVQACSACAGDYENPERTAQREGEVDEEDDKLLTRGSADDADSSECDEFPADEM